MLQLRVIGARWRASVLLAACATACSSPTPALAPVAAPDPQASPAAPSSAPAVRTVSAPAKPPSGPSTAAVAHRHYHHLQGGDLDALLVDYADDALLMTAAGALRGTEAIRGYLASRIEEFGAEGSSFLRGDVRVNKEVAYVVWSGRTASRVYDVASDTFVVRGGKIIAQGVAGQLPADMQGAEAGALPDGPSTTIVESHLDAFEKGQVDDLVADYHPVTSIILTQRGKKVGPPTIQKFLEEVLAQVRKPSVQLEKKRVFVEGEIGYVAWSVTTEQGAEGFVSDTFVIRDGKIAFQTITLRRP